MSTKAMWAVDIVAPLYRAAMYQGRFEFILCLRSDNPETKQSSKKTDKLASIIKVFDQFIKNCETLHTPNEYLRVDEQLLVFWGQFPFTMYITSKPAKYGIKQVLINDNKSKYLLGEMPYLGKDGTRP